MNRFGWFFVVAMSAVSVAPSRPARGAERVASGMETEIVRGVTRALPGARVATAGRGGIQIAGARLASGDSAGLAQRAFVDRFVPATGARVDQLELKQTVDVMGGRFVLYVYDQRPGGIVADGAYLKILVRNESGFPVVLAHARLLAVDGGAVAAAGGLNADEAVAAVQQAAPEVVLCSVPELVWAEVAGGVRAVWRFYGDNGEPGARYDRWQFLVDRLTGAVVGRRPGICHVDVIGTITGFQTPPPFPDTAANAEQNVGVNGARVRIAGGATAFTDANGNFVLPNAGATPVAVDVDLVGQWATIINDGTGGLLSDSQTVTPPGPVAITLNPSPTEFLTSQLNAITEVSNAHDFVKSLNPSYTGYDVSIETHVNVASSCNATFIIGDPRLRFGRNGGGCFNSAFSSIVHHEYGHFVVDASPAGAGAIIDYHEGMADAFAALMGDDPCIGPDLLGLGAGCLRDLELDDEVFPASMSDPSPHTRGLILGNSFWDLRTELAATLGSSQGLAVARDLFLGQVFAGAHQIDPAVVVDLLTLDDDDGDITNSTPHHDEICTAFGAHGLTCPPLVYLTFDFPNGLPAAVRPDGNPTTNRVAVNVLSHAAAPVSGSGLFHWRFGSAGAFNEAPMTEVSANQYEVDLPGGTCGDTLEYYFSAEAVGQVAPVTDPPSAPGLVHAAVVATSLTAAVSDDFETNQGWTVTNDAGLTAGAWERGIPAGDGSRNDPPTDFDGSGQCFVTGNAPGDSDVDGGTTALVSPVFDISGLAIPHVHYARWFANHGGQFGGEALDVLTVEFSDDGGASWTPVETVGPTGPQSSGGWFERTVRVQDFVSPTSQFRVRVSVADLTNPSVVEGGFDAFDVLEVSCPTCSDGVQDFGEGRIDCGGPFCAACACLTTNDCFYCSGEACDPFGQCVVGALPCAPGKACDETSDTCFDCQVDADCSNGVFCDGAEICDAVSGCVPPSVPNPCVDPLLSVCDESNDLCVRACVVDADCDDQIPCTVDRCDFAINGCANEFFPFGDLTREGSINIFDLFCLLDGLAGTFSDCPFEAVDISPCGGDATVNVFDLFAMLDALGGADPCCAGP